jgi:predicted phage baseplate assembly protein
MGVDVPDLDDRTYEELLSDIKRRIPVVDEEWTDHNAHDPGITFLELLSWLSESYQFQLDQIEDRHRRKYAKLLGVTPDSPRPAKTKVRVESSTALTGESVPAGSRLLATEGQKEQVFQTTQQIPLTDASVGKVIADTTEGRTDQSAATTSRETYFRPFGPTATAGSTLYIGFEGDPLADPTAPLAITVDFHDEELPPPAAHGTESDEFEPSVELTWEYCTNYRNWEWSSAWESFEVVDDTTKSLYGSGVVTLAHPGLDHWEGIDPYTPGVLEAEEEYAWIRVRLSNPGYEIPPQLNWIQTNILTVEQRGTGGPVRLHRSDGAEQTSARPHQRFEFDRSPVLEATITVGDETWTQVEDFDGSGPAATHYILHQSEGAIEFGDNVRGAVPDPDQPVRAPTYVFGGGPAGNVPADSEWSFARPNGTAGEQPPDWAPAPAVRSATVESLGAATGGQPAEQLDDAFVRLRKDLETPYRAVTLDDCEYIALHTPGLRFGRAKAIVTDGRSARGCVDHETVQVVVVPFSPPAVDRPTPSEAFLDEVRCHLEQHRLLTDRVTATAPTYVDIGVQAEIELKDGYVPERRRVAVIETLDEYLSPLRGFEGTGWPFGRPVYYSELYELLDAVEGVDCVTDIDVSASGDVTITSKAVEIPDTALVAPADHSVTISGTGRQCGEIR